MNEKHGKKKNSVGVTVYQTNFSGVQASYAKVQRQTAYMGDVVDEIIKLNGEIISREVLFMVAGLLRDAMLSLLKDGNSVDLLELGIMYPTARGGIDNANPSASDIPPITVGVTPSALAKKAVEGVSVTEPQKYDSLPSVKQFIDVATCKETTEFTAKGSVKLIGSRLKIAGEKNDAGVFFAPQKDDGNIDNSGGDWVQVAEDGLAENKAGHLLLTLPASLQTGKKYSVIIKTAYGGGNRLLKTAKSAVVGSDITVA